MPAAAIVTLALTALLVAALAFYLIWVIILLASIGNRLGGIADALGSIARRTEPVNSLMAEINADLGAVADALGGAVEVEEAQGGQDAEEAATF